MTRQNLLVFVTIAVTFLSTFLALSSSSPSLSSSSSSSSRCTEEDESRRLNSVISENKNEAQKWNASIWALLVAGSNEYYNYRHQADVCHAFHVLKEHGIPESNIIVMMYDDIAHSEDNPTPGVILNQPGGSNVYAGVPKDYTNREVSNIQQKRSFSHNSSIRLLFCADCNFVLLERSLDHSLLFPPELKHSS